jgi:elongation factor Ts
MAITAAMVKELREQSGAGMMDCKKALTATDGDMEKAIDYLRENGMVKAAKKADRIAAEGLCEGLVSEDGKKAAVVEVNSETDFVAKNDLFKGFVHQVAQQAMDTEAADLDAFMAEPWKFEEGKTVNDALVAEIAVISENLKIRRFAKMSEENGFITAYTHAGGKIVVLVDVETDVCNDAVVEMAKNVAMQAAAMRPKYNSRAEVSQEYIEKEKEVLLAAAKNEKPNANEKIWNGMVMGRINKELADICLQDQVYVKAEDGKQTVSKYIAQVAKENNAKINVKGFIRFETGEGIEKKVENFAEEVAAQRKG